MFFLRPHLHKKLEGPGAFQDNTLSLEAPGLRAAKPLTRYKNKEEKLDQLEGCAKVALIVVVIFVILVLLLAVIFALTAQPPIKTI